jgi:hypothetical protein
MGLFHGVAARLALKITIDSLQRGQHIECKDLNEVMDAEDALKQACLTLKMYLQTAATFDGGAVVIDYSKDEPEIVSQPMLLAAPVALAPIVQPTPNGFVPSPQDPPAFGPAFNAPPPGTNPLQPVLEWWSSRTNGERKWIMIIGGIVIILILVKIL